MVTYLGHLNSLSCLAIGQPNKSEIGNALLYNFLKNKPTKCVIHVIASQFSIHKISMTFY